jgi:hypothetical protein
MSFDLPTWVVPYALWSGHRAPANWPPNDGLPNMRQWLRDMHRTSVIHEAPHGALPTSLAMPHEVAQAQALGWDFADGCVPWAANAAAEQHLSADTSAWAFVTMCNWHVSNGQVTMGDPAHLQIDADTDAQLFKSMQDFFAQDGIALYPSKPGQWLAQSGVFANLPTASLDRVIGRNIDPWLVGGVTPTGPATLLRRLQNEMQMLLYTHALNADRWPAINSFWVSGCGALPAQTHTGVQVHNTLRETFLQQHPAAWAAAWEELAHALMAPALQQGDSLVLCGTDRCLAVTANSPSLWQQFLQKIRPQSWVKLLS